MSDANGHREHLEERANQVRSKLEQRLHMIDERRQRVADIARSATRPPASVILLAVAGVAATLFLVQKLRTRRSNVDRILRLLESSSPPQNSALKESLKKATTSLAVLAVKRAGQRGLDRWLAEPAESQQSASAP